MKELHYLRCRNCKRLQSRAVRLWEKERCDQCYSRMEYLYTVPVETPEQERLWARGVVFNPHPDRAVLFTCSRCERQFESGLLIRGGKPCCKDCWHAEATPRPLLTIDEQRERQARKRAVLREMEESQERAYQKAEAQR